MKGIPREFIFKIIVVISAIAIIISTLKLYYYVIFEEEVIEKHEINGMLNCTEGGIYDWIYSFMICNLILFLFDVVICKKIFKLKRGTGGGARWFVVHSFCNTLIVYYGYQDMLKMFVDPVSIIYENNISSINPTAYSISLHFYHTVGYHSDFTFVDWLHHGIMYLITIPLLLLQNPTPITNANFCFITGIPGCIDYLLLALVKIDVIESQTEKSINRYLNVWIRAPGIFWVTAMGYVYAFQQRANNTNYTESQFYGLMIILLTNYWNAFYFLERVVASHYKHQTLENLKQKVVNKQKTLG